MQASALIGSTIADKYTLLSVAGSGGMGTVFKAQQVDLDRLVAVKILNPIEMNDADSVKRFEREAKSIASLSSSHIAAFYSYGVLNNGCPFIVMEWLDGISLAARIYGELLLDSEETIHIGRQIADALATAHASGIFHRDLKPSNVLLVSQPEADFVKLIDFGLARIENTGETMEQKLTSTGALIGTPLYLSPEQCSGMRADARSDIYSLGCILYEMLCLEPPFQADNPIGLLHKHINEKVPSLEEKSKVLLPDGLEQVVLKCLQKNPAHRYQSMSALADDLLRVRERRFVASSEPIRSDEVRADDEVPQVPSGMSDAARELRRKVILARFLAVIILLVGVAAFAFFQWLGSPAGQLAKTNFVLKNKPNRTQTLECLDTAERLAKRNDFNGILEIEDGAAHALKLDDRDPVVSARANIDLANELLKRGDNAIAFDFGFRAFKSLIELSFAHNQPDGRLRVLCNSMDDAASVMIRSNQTLGKKRLSTVMEAIRRLYTPFANVGRPETFDLALLSMAKEKVPLNSDLVLCLFGKDVAIARTGPLNELEKNLSKSVKAMSSIQSPEATPPKPSDPYLIEHYTEIAEACFDRESGLTEKYLQMANELLQKIKQNSSLRQNNERLAYICEQLSEIYRKLGDSKKALQYATDSVSFFNGNNIGSAVRVNNFVRVLFDVRNYKKAQIYAEQNFQYLQSLDSSNGAVLRLRAECAMQLAQIALIQNKKKQAISILTSELDAQKENCEPLMRARIYSVLFSCYFGQAHNKDAYDCIKTVRADRAKVADLSSREELSSAEFQMAQRLKDPQLEAEIAVESLNDLQRNKDKGLQIDWLNMFSDNLNTLRNSCDAKVYAQLIEFIQDGFTQNLSSNAPQPAALAHLVNSLGSSGEEKVADLLRSQATEKLTPANAAVFLSRCMDFVVADSKDGSRYADPQHAAKVYLDLAHNMQSKGDAESAFKYGFEAMKIVRVLSIKYPERRAQLLDTADDAAVSMMASKQAISAEQWRICFEVASLETDAIKKGGKDHLLDLVLQTIPAKTTEDLPPELFACMLLKEQSLIDHKQFAEVEAQVNRTVKACDKSQTMALVLAEHVAEIAQSLNDRHEGATARRLANLSKRLLDELPADISGLDSDKIAQVWSKDSATLAGVGDRQAALFCARKSVSVKPLQDISSGELRIGLVDRLLDMGAYVDAASLASDVCACALLVDYSKR